jgi:hypothetical protein
MMLGSVILLLRGAFRGGAYDITMFSLAESSQAGTLACLRTQYPCTKLNLDTDSRRYGVHYRCCICSRIHARRMDGLCMLLPACKLSTRTVCVAVSSDLPVCVPTHGPRGLEVHTVLATLASATGSTGCSVRFRLSITSNA